MENDLIFETRDDSEIDDKSRKASATQLIVLAVMLIVPLLLVAAKLPGAPSAEFFMRYLSLAHMPLPQTIGHVLFVPMAAMLVVFFRLTLGIRVLGPFRAILLTFAFQLTGVVAGLIFLVITVGTIVSVRPLVRSLQLPYFGRITVMLSLVAVLILIGVLTAKSLHPDIWRGLAHFPVVVLCLVSEALARSIKSEGLAAGLWRGAMTALVAVLLTWLSESPALTHLLFSYPELLIVQIAMIVVISKFCAWRILQGLNPSIVHQFKHKVGRQQARAHQAQVSQRINDSTSFWR